MSLLKYILKETVSNLKLYHGTSLENAKNILDGYNNEPVYFSVDYEEAEEYALSHENSAIIEIQSQSHNIEPNHTLINYYEDNNFELDDDELEMWDEWENSEQTWKDSLDIFTSVVVTGNIRGKIIKV